MPGAGGTLWEQRDLPAAFARDRLDVFFAPGYTAPLFGRIPTITAIHDISFVAHPEWFRTREGIRRRLLTRQTAAMSRAVITISDFSRRELIERLGVPPQRIHVIPPGVEPPGGAVLAPPTRGTTEPRVLYVGSIFNRRHVPDLIRAVARLSRRHPDVSLALVGSNRTYPHQDIAAVIDAHRPNVDVTWQPYVTDAELLALYRSSGAFAFLSEYEGLGLTPLEALACGVPPLLLDTPIARESCGDAAVYVPPDNVTAASDALERLLFDDTVRQRVLGASPAVLARYNWAAAAIRTLGVIESAL